MTLFIFMTFRTELVRPEGHEFSDIYFGLSAEPSAAGPRLARRSSASRRPSRQSAGPSAADDDRILGAQIVGGAGVDKRIDVIAVAMSAGMSASSLMDLELAYAPQYGSAKDLVNMIGYVADNAAAYPGSTVQWHELAAQREAGATLIDVRSVAEFAAGHIPGAVNVPLPDLRDGHDGLTGSLIVHCQVGQRGHTAQRLLSQLGHEVRNLYGGYLTWRAGIAAQTRETASVVS